MHSEAARFSSVLAAGLKIPVSRRAIVLRETLEVLQPEMTEDLSSSPSAVMYVVLSTTFLPGQNEELARTNCPNVSVIYRVDRGRFYLPQLAVARTREKQARRSMVAE